MIRRALSAGPLLLIWLGLAATAQASGQWYNDSTSPVDPSSYYKTNGVITGLKLDHKPPLMQLMTDDGEELAFIIPKWALISVKGKLVRLGHLKKGQQGMLMWTVMNDQRVVGSFDIVPPEPLKPLPPASKMQRPAIPRLGPSVAPSIPVQPAPAPAPAAPRPITPVAPSSQDLRR